MKSTRPTLRTLAAEAGVSAMTFSLALRNRPEISAATRRRLQRLARLRGYQPDPTIAKLMQHLRLSSQARGQANICGLIEAGGSDDGGRHEFAIRVQSGLKKRAESLGFAFSTMELPAEAHRAGLQRVLRSRGVEGVVILPMPRQRDLSALLDWEYYSVVSVTSSVTAPRVHTVTPNHFDNIIRACRRLTEEGYRRIGLAISRDWDERVRHRWAGGVAWQNAFGRTESVPPFLGAGVGPRLADPGFAAWLDSHRPDVIGSVAIEILAGMVSRGERGIPERPLSIMVDGEWVSSLR